jgi:hypothetical protein
MIDRDVCYFHGGKTPRGKNSPNYKHGKRMNPRYRDYLPEAVRDKVESYQDNDPLDLLPELEVQRALFSTYIERFQEGSLLTAGDINMLMQWTEGISRMVERIVKMRNDTALTGAEVTFLVARMNDVITKYIAPEKQQAFIDELFNGFVPAASNTPKLTSRT